MQIQSAAHQIQLASCPQCNRAAWRPAGYQDGQSLFCDRMGDLTYAGAIQQVETTLDFFFFFTDWNKKECRTRCQELCDLLL